MRQKGARGRAWIAVIVVAALAPPAARAGLIAAVDVPVGGTATDCPTQTDIALIDPATGTRFPLPANVNTSLSEVHPSINALGTRLVFARVDLAGGTRRIIVEDLSTGQQADLFSLFDATQLQPSTPSLTPDGGGVLTGAALAATSGSQFAAADTLTSLASFPGGPFPHPTVATGAHFGSAGETMDPVQRSDGLTATATFEDTGQHVVLNPVSGSFRIASGGHPALSDPSTNVVVLQVHKSSVGREVLQFLPVATFGTAAATDLPAVINADGPDELNPAFTADGRYLGFVRYAEGGDKHLRLFVFDTATQTMLNASGVDLGRLPDFGCPIGPIWPFRGGLSLRETLVLVTSSLTFSGLSGRLSFGLLQSSAVGILVQRIVGHHRLLGHVVPTLVTIGRVPFGHFKRGSHNVRWNLRVGGHRLGRGTYLVTPRLLTASGVGRELGRPRTLQIR